MAALIEGESLAITASAVSSNRSLTPDVPIGFGIGSVWVTNPSSNPITFSLGTTSGGSDVVNAFTIPAGFFSMLPAASLLKPTFSTTSTQTLYVSSGAWAGTIDLVVRLLKAVP